MTELLVAPPPMEVIGAMAAIPRLAISPSVLVTQQGPGEDGQLGPEAAGAILVLQSTFTDAAKAEAFWVRAVDLMALLSEAPGFIRRYAFPDGPTITMIALWRTAADARAFGASPEHRAAVRDLYQEGWQHSHFSAIWEVTSNHGRVAFCECGGVTPIGEGTCSACGAELFDLYRTATA